MLEVIKTQATTTDFNQVSQSACEVRQFMQNFFEAVHGGNYEEILTYFADDMEPFKFPLHADWVDDTLVVNDHLATYSCSLRMSPGLRLQCLLDKSEGYWQIIHGEFRNENLNH